MHRLRDPDEFGIAVSGASLVADFFSRQAEPTYVEQFQGLGCALDFQEAHVRARISASLPPGWAAIGLMRSPASSSWYGMEGGEGMLACTPPGEVIDGRITPGFQCLAVSVSPVLWDRCRLLAGVEREHFGAGTATRIPPPIFEKIERQLCRLRGLLRQDASAVHAVEEAVAFITQVMTMTWELHSSVRVPRESLRNRVRLARRAEAWMRDHLSEPIGVPDICLALRVSRRELEYAFCHTFDQSPRSFLQALRLNAIRRALRRSDGPTGNVSHVVLDHGITHLGRFAAQYRALFGENPSET
ncbi:helix-turn-helix domain-containing protein [Phragmitibacter flavus]|uniref:helix-turn-helix domain-containing protein n=1 Tax=Phragmitibacter flavus TaxID=2576071 RepID=UPI0010FE9213|nr:helix-turn-helix domain-containing protein [Phragmitibacter flavus]